jgi:Pentapeptide repeats (8 copies)
VSANDVLTLIVAIAAVAVPLAALFISNHVDERAARSALSDLTLTISQKITAYDELDVTSKFAPSREVEMLVLQAEYLIQRLTTRRRILYPQSSVATTLAMALDKVNDFSWSDKYWPVALEAAEDHFKPITSGYWGAALCRRGALTQGRAVVDRCLESMSSLKDPDSCIVNADTCLTMAQWDKTQAAGWLNRAKEAYASIPKNDDRYEAYVPEGVPRLTLRGFDFSDANLRHAGLTDADFTGGTLIRTDFTGAKLTNVDLTGANTTGAIFTDADLTGAIIDQDAVTPDGWERDAGSGRLSKQA